MSVIYIKDKVITKNEDKIEIGESFSFGKNDIITSSIDLKDVIPYIFKLPKSLSGEELNAQAELYFYENAGLDLTKKYKTHYFIKDINDEENHIIEAIAISNDKLNEIFNPVTEKTKYIDYISLSFLAFEKFYEVYEKEPQNDAFVYVDDNQSFVSIFKDGKYVYARTLPDIKSLLKPLGMEYEKFIQIVSEKGLIQENYTDGEEFIFDEINKFFSDYFTNINNRFSYGRSVFQIEQINNIYFYTPFHIEGLEEITGFWSLSGINFEKLSIEELFLEKLIFEYNSTHYEDKENFSIFPRPPKFYKTKTFQLLSVIFATLLVFGGDFGYRYYQNKQLETKIDNISNTLHKKEAVLKKLEAKTNFMKNEISKYEKQINSINSKINHIKEVLKTSIKYLDDRKKTDDFLKISSLLKETKLNSYRIENIDNNFIINISTKPSKRENITNFINKLIFAGYKDVSTKLIEDKNKIYSAQVRFSK
jgi:cell division protein FtsB